MKNLRGRRKAFDPRAAVAMFREGDRGVLFDYMVDELGLEYEEARRRVAAAMDAYNGTGDLRIFARAYGWKPLTQAVADQVIVQTLLGQTDHDWSLLDQLYDLHEATGGDVTMLEIAFSNIFGPLYDYYKSDIDDYIEMVEEG